MLRVVYQSAIVETFLAASLKPNFLIVLRSQPTVGSINSVAGFDQERRGHRRESTDLLWYRCQLFIMLEGPVHVDTHPCNFMSSSLWFRTVDTLS